MPEKDEKWVEGKHRRLYEETLVRNIILTTAYCIKDLIEENPEVDDEDIYEFVEDNYGGIINDTLEEFQNQNKKPAENAEISRLPDEDSELEIDDEEDEEIG